MTTMDPQWALLAGALVFIITPGIALFYGGRERATSMVNMMMLSAGAIAVTTLVWTLWGWSLAFAGKDMAGGVIGDPLSGLLFRDSMVADHGVFTSMDANSGLSGGIPAAFRLACAVVAVALSWRYCCNHTGLDAVGMVVSFCWQRYGWWCYR